MIPSCNPNWVARRPASQPNTLGLRARNQVGDGDGSRVPIWRAEMVFRQQQLPFATQGFLFARGHGGEEAESERSELCAPSPPCPRAKSGSVRPVSQHRLTRRLAGYLLFEFARICCPFTKHYGEIRHLTRPDWEG